MKYDVIFSCGHTETVQLYGKTTDRERKIKFFEQQGLCSCCYKQGQNENAAVGCHEEKMFYGDYKKHFSEFETKKDSYNPGTKEITVYIPDDRAEYLYRKILSAYILDDLEELMTIAGNGDRIKIARKRPDYETQMQENYRTMANATIKMIRGCRN